jgi:hypothetical protein
MHRQSDTQSCDAAPGNENRSTIHGPARISGPFLSHRRDRFARWRIVDDTLGALDLANGTLTVPESSQTDYRWCAFAPRVHQGYRVEMNTRAGLG